MRRAEQPINNQHEGDLQPKAHSEVQACFGRRVQKNGFKGHFCVSVLARSYGGVRTYGIPSLSGIIDEYAHSSSEVQRGEELGSAGHRAFVFF